MWFLLLLCTAHIKLVLLKDPSRLILKNGTNPCEGHIEIFHENTWGYVDDAQWSGQIEKVVCRNTHCGTFVSSESIYLDDKKKVWLDKLTCKGSENHLDECDINTWNVEDKKLRTTKQITCSRKIKIGLDGFKCAGAVMYTDEVGESGYFCNDNWGKQEADLVCKNLQCGTAKDFQSDWKVLGDASQTNLQWIKCSGIENLDSLWQCVTQETKSCSKLASVTCKDHKSLQLSGSSSNVCSGQLQIEEGDKWRRFQSSDEIRPDLWCQQMHCGTNASHRLDDDGMQLNCTDNVSIVLKDNEIETECYGTVHVRVNGEDRPVCGTSWTNKNAEVVCRELKCGNVVMSTPLNIGKEGEFECSGSEASLWHCKARHNMPTCSSTVSIVCADSVNVQLVDGPGDCAGRVAIHYQGKWQRVSSKSWTDINSKVVCKHLGCGTKRSESEIFSSGSGNFLTNVNCNSDASPISQCMKDVSSSNTQEKAVMLTCEAHKVVYLKGQHSCSGEVWIKHDKDSYWLSGSNETWDQEAANTVCQQMHCGYAHPPTSVSSAGRVEQPWNEFYNCSPNTTSLFKCETVARPPDYNATIATVRCSDNITMGLSQNCRGTVKVCVGEDCGGVCKDAWTIKTAVRLCEDLGCGTKVLNALGTPEQTKVTIKSVHIMDNSANLTQGIFIKNDEKDTTCNRSPAYVVCSGSLKVRINASSHRCSGNVEVYYDGKWLPVCRSAIGNAEAQNAACEAAQCGHGIKSVDYFGPKREMTNVISDIKCDGSKSFNSCSIASAKKTCTPSGLKCSDSRGIALLSDKACSGKVFVHSEGQKNLPSAVSATGWTNPESQRLCQDLNCGNFVPKAEEKPNELYPFWSSTFNCANESNLENIWQCEKSTSPPLKQKQLVITCQGEPNVTLSGQCGGQLRINNISVCNSQWKISESDLVCKEQNCGKAVFNGTSSRTDAKHYHLNCEKNYHRKLGQCNRYEEKCDGGPVTVYCSDQIQFNTSQKCGGWIVVKYRSFWEGACVEELPSRFKDRLCQKLGCGQHNKTKVRNSAEPQLITFPSKLETKLNCNSQDNDLRYCTKHEPCEPDRAAEIYCDDYPDPPIIVDKPEIKIVPIVLGVGFLFIALILIFVLVRVWKARRTKRLINVSSRKAPEKEEEYESGEYEDVMVKSNEMNVLSHGRFHSNSEVITENEARSTSSFPYPYDDIDEVVETRPLTSPGAKAGKTGDNCFPEGALDSQSHSDDATYEVDDPLEGYDDIEASTEIVQTQAEVHNSPQSPPESAAVAAASEVQGDEDYLVPGQDG